MRNLPDLSLIERLEKRIAQPLPGLIAQLEMASTQRGRHWTLQPDHKKSAVLMLLYPRKGHWYLVLMKRPDTGKVHGGQVSFPGGRMEPSDPDYTFTALRESEEELGIKPSGVQVIGDLTELYIPVSNYLVYPVLGFAKKRPKFIPSPDEVAAVIEARLDFLMHPQTVNYQRVRLSNGQDIQVPAFRVENHVIWGATGMILNELLTLIREIQN